jgi:hypothetical protein
MQVGSWSQSGSQVFSQDGLLFELREGLQNEDY